MKTDVRGDHGDALIAANIFMAERSTANQRMECWWSISQLARGGQGGFRHHLSVHT